jgi:hypothetical protein
MLSDCCSNLIYVKSHLIQIQFLRQSISSAQEGPRTFDWSGVELDLSEVYMKKIRERRKAKIGNNLSRNQSTIGPETGGHDSRQVTSAIEPCGASA